MQLKKVICKTVFYFVQGPQKVIRSEKVVAKWRKKCFEVKKLKRKSEKRFLLYEAKKSKRNSEKNRCETLRKEAKKMVCLFRKNMRKLSETS
jgi:3-hydroxyacyl-CoA dehydrogenase